ASRFRTRPRITWPANSAATAANGASMTSPARWMTAISGDGSRSTTRRKHRSCRRNGSRRSSICTTSAGWWVCSRRRRRPGKAMDMDIELIGERVNARALPMDRLDMRFVVSAGRVRVERLVFYVADGRIAGAVMVDGGTESPEAAADLVVSDLDLKPFFRE